MPIQKSDNLHSFPATKLEQGDLQLRHHLGKPCPISLSEFRLWLPLQLRTTLTACTASTNFSLSRPRSTKRRPSHLPCSPPIPPEPPVLIGTSVARTCYPCASPQLLRLHAACAPYLPHCLNRPCSTSNLELVCPPLSAPIARALSIARRHASPLLSKSNVLSQSPVLPLLPPTTAPLSQASQPT